MATDTLFANVPSIYSGGCKMAQGFVGQMSMVADVYLMNSQKEFVQTLTVSWRPTPSDAIAAKIPNVTTNYVSIH